MRLWGQALDPHAAWLIERGMRTLAVRMARHNENAQAVAEWASEHPGFAAVHYPGLPTHQDYAVARAEMDGFGGMVGLELKDGIHGVTRFLRRLKLIIHAPSLAGVESLISEPRYTSHRHIGQTDRERMGIPDGFLRLSCGIEDVEDIIADLEQALEH
jgi:cystathionine beta-lyase/cystathionine gamma-synthase